MSEPQLVYNAVRTPDGTILESRSRHDYVCHTDANGIPYCVDGGLAYLSRSWGSGEPAEELSLYEDGDIRLIREVVLWGTYGKEGDEPLHYLKLKDMETSHIEAVLETQLQMNEGLRAVMNRELEYRRAFSC